VREAKVITKKLVVVREGAGRSPAGEISMTIRHWLLLLAGTLAVPAVLPAAAPAVSGEEREQIERRLKELDGRLAKLRGRTPAVNADHLADAAVYAKGIAWALQSDEVLTPADAALLKKAVERGNERAAALEAGRRTWAAKRGKVVRWNAKVLPKLPLRWTRDEVQVGNERYAAADHAPVLMQPNSLADERYVVLNSGHTFHEKEPASLNDLLFPRLGDWAVMKVGDKVPKEPSVPLEENVVRAGFFDERWQFPEPPATAGDAPSKQLAPFFKPPEEFAGKFGDYKSPLKFADGRAVKSADEWPQRRQEILKSWHEIMGPWPERIEKPKVEFLDKEKRDGLTQYHVRLEIAPKLTMDDAYLLVPDGKGPLPAVLVVFYDAKTGIGQGRSERCDFALQLAKRGFVTLSLGSAPASFYPNKEKAQLQPLSFHAYVAANCHTILAALPQVDAKRIGVVGHSYGGKWAMFAACLYDKFACGVWSDPGIVFDEKRSNVNYWEPWYLGYQPGAGRKPGIPTEANPRTGAYKRLVEGGHDLHELHALMAPRPFLVSGGAEDGPGRWKALNHSVAVNDLLRAKNRVAMTNRKGHSPTDESNERIVMFFEYALKQGQPAAPAKEK